jgi:DNA modification methylase
LKKPYLIAKNWSDHGIDSIFPERILKPFSQHPHIKPFGLITRLIAATTKPGDLVVDPAAGSFVVMRAALALGRNFVGCDIDAPYDGNLDLERSLNACYAEVRARVAAEGKGWIPK